MALHWIVDDKHFLAQIENDNSEILAFVLARDQEDDNGVIDDALARHEVLVEVIGELEEVVGAV